MWDAAFSYQVSLPQLDTQYVKNFSAGRPRDPQLPDVSVDLNDEIAHEMSEGSSDPLAHTLRFFTAIKRYRLLLICSLCAAVVFAFVTYRRTPKQYEASVSLLIRPSSTTSSPEPSLAAGGMLSAYRQLILSDPVLSSALARLESLPPEISSTAPKEQWPSTLRGMLSVAFSPETNVLQASCRSRDAASTVSVLEALSVASSGFMEDFQQDISLDLVKRLDAERQQLGTRLIKQERELLAARKACGDVILSGQEDRQHPAIAQMTQLHNELTDVRTRRLQMESVLTLVRQLVEADADLTQALRQMEAVLGPQAVAHFPGNEPPGAESLQELKSQLAEMLAEQEAMSQHFGTGHAEMMRRQVLLEAHQARLEDARQAQQDRLRVGVRERQVGEWMIAALVTELNGIEHYESSLQQEYEAAERKVLSLSDNLAEIQAAERELATLRELYSSLLNRLNALDIEQGGGAFRIAVLTQPQLPSSPASPVLKTTLIKSVIFTLVATLLVIYVLDMLDDRFRAPEQIAQELGLPVLGITRRHPSEQASEARIYVHGFPETSQSECYRIMRTGLAAMDAPSRCLVITSTAADEGKSTVCLNLGATFARIGRRTLLIDADLRRTGLSKQLELNSCDGLSGLLTRPEVTPEMCRELTLRTEVSGLDVLPRGSGIADAASLLCQPTLAMVLDWARAEYDQILIDCPPALGVSDAGIVGRYVDGLLFLVNPTQSRRRDVVRAVQYLRSLGLQLLGVAVNSTHSDSDVGWEDYSYGDDYTPDSPDHKVTPRVFQERSTPNDKSGHGEPPAAPPPARAA